MEWSSAFAFALAQVAGLDADATDHSNFAKDLCKQTEISVDLGKSFAGGVVEILLPLPDTHARDPIRFDANNPICIPLETMTRLEKAYSSDRDISDHNSLYFITYDPEGTIFRSRSYFDYTALMCEELPSIAKPPKDLLFARFRWTKRAGIKAVRVDWENDLRAEQEKDCEGY